MKHARRRSTQLRLAAIEQARALLLTIAQGNCDLILTYRQLYGIYLNTSGFAEELKPLFRIPGIYVDSIILNNEVRRGITEAAIQWLINNPKQDD